MGAIWFCLVATVGSLLQAPEAPASLLPVGLRCESAENPMSVDATHPRLSWRLASTSRDQAQSAYQILVATSPKSLSQGQGDLWDSGKVPTNESVGIPYRGSPLKSSQSAFWKVRVWDRAGQVSEWSKPGRWDMGLLTPQDWQAQWLNDGKPNPQSDADFYADDPAPLFRKEFGVAKRLARARLYVCGLGYYEASLNGKRVGDHVLDPGWTRYSEQCLYSAFDVTGELRQGRNCLGVTLGNGWYNPLPLRLWGRRNIREEMPVGRPRFIARLELEFTDGTREAIVSDAGWKTGEGPIRFNSIYLGEIYDARKEITGWDRPGFDDSGWRPVAVATEPMGALRAQTQPPIRVTKTLKALKVTEPKPGVFICDFGQNFAGWAKLKLSAPAGTRVVLRYGELLNPDGTLNPMTSVAGQVKGTRKNSAGEKESVGGPGAPPIAWQTDTYIAHGKGVESYTPRFTFHAFRYVEVTGLSRKPALDQLTGLRLNADVERAGSFTCSNERFNRIQTLCDWTFLSGIFSVQSDCPHRERFAYGGDIAATSEAFLMNYDMSAFYAKTVRDWKDSARSDGMLTDTAPFVGIQYCGIAWAMVHPLLQRQLYQYYGDRQLIAEQYETARRWLELEAKKNPKFIVPSGLSDHEALTPAPAPAMVTPLFAASARMVGELAAILGRDEDAGKYAQLSEQIRQAYLQKFFDPASGKVGPGSQASQAFALYLNLLPAEQRPAALRWLVEDIRDRQTNHLTTGIFGTKFMLATLSDADQAELASTLVNRKTFPGWGYMLENGATTLWEHWKGSDNTYSHNHPMFGSVSEWFYQWLGGIQPAPDAVGFDRIVIRPQAVREVDWVRSSYNSVRGQIVSNWKRDGGRLKLEIEIPANTSALVYLPSAEGTPIKEDGRPVAKAEGVRLLREGRGHAVLAVGSGRYSFETTPQITPTASAN